MEKEIACTLENEGFIGHYYPGTKETNKAIISVGGASCNEKVSIAMSNMFYCEFKNLSHMLIIKRIINLFSISSTFHNACFFHFTELV